MAKQTFTAGQVLTAAQMNDLQTNDFNLSVTTQTGNYTLVSADKGTREVANSATAITFTIPSATFAAGDIVEIHNIGAGTLTLSGSGVTINSADVLTVAQWQGGTLYFTSATAAIWFPRAKTVSSGLVYVTGASFTTATTVSMASGVFTGTYDNYKVILNISGSSTGQILSMRVNNAGSPRTAANYNGAKLDARADTTSVVTVGSSSATSMNFGATGTVISANYDFTVYGPAISTRATQWSYTGAGVNDGINITSSINGGGQYSVNEANDGLTFFVGGTISGTYRVYGIVNS